METKGWSMKKMLMATSLFEGATGLALMTSPSFVINLLLGSHLTDPLSIIITRVAGAALVSLAIVCWLLRNSKRINGLIIAILFYNLASIVLLGYAGLHDSLIGVALWPAIAEHIFMAGWCAKLLYWDKS